MAYIVGQNRNQITFLPETLEDYVSQDNPVRVIDAFVDNLDSIDAGFKDISNEGRPGYDPRTELKLYLYGYFNTIRSSRKLMKECRRNIEVMWLLKKLMPDFRTIADFRKNNAKALKNVFRAFVKVCMELDLYGKELVAIDGSKFQAVNSKDRNFTKPKLEDKLKRIEKNIEKYLEELDNTDSNSEDIDYKEKYTKEKLQILTARKETYNGYLKEMLANNETQKSLTDPESRLMITRNGGYEVSYNVQTAVDSKNHMIVDFDVTNKCADSGLLYENAERAREILEIETLEVVADKGYEDKEDILRCLNAGIIPNVALKNDATKVEIVIDYKETEITKKEIDSTRSEDIQKCLEAGILPEIYKSKDINIEIIEVTEAESSEKKFVLTEDMNSVICPEGEILNKTGYSRTRSINRFSNKFACKNCSNKCTKSKFKLVELKSGKSVSYSKSQNKINKQKVIIKFKPSKQKIKDRKCIVEHPFGTVKRWCNGSYLLMNGKVKSAADLSLSFLSYNIKRAINMLGVEKLIESMT